MKTQQDIFDLITELNGNTGLIVIPREFIKITGDYETAALLAQLVYWTGKSQNEGWIYKTYQDWENELGISKHKVSKARDKLEKLGLIQTQVKKANGNPTVHYKVNMKTLSNLLREEKQDKNVSQSDLKVKKSENESQKNGNGKLKTQQNESQNFGKTKVKNSAKPLTEITNINYKHKNNIYKEKSESVNEDFENYTEPVIEKPEIIRPAYLVTELPREENIDPKQLEQELQRLIAFYPKKSGNFRRLRDRYRYLRLKKKLRFEEIYEAIDGYMLEMDAQGVEQKYWKTLDTLFDPVELDPWLYKPTISIDKKGQRFKGEFCIATRVIRYYVPKLNRIETQILPEKKVDQMIEEGRLIFLDKDNIDQEVKEVCHAK